MKASGVDRGEPPCPCKEPKKLLGGGAFKRATFLQTETEAVRRTWVEAARREPTWHGGEAENN